MSRTSKWLSAVLTATACALGYVPAASAAVPANLTQQGRLLDSTGTPVDGSISFTFTIYDAATAGTTLWTETDSVTVDQGYFSVRLGEKTAFGATVFDGSKTLYLGVAVGTDAEMTPRQQITSVPFALHAGMADTATTATTAAHVPFTGITSFPTACTAPNFLTGFDSTGAAICTAPQGLSCTTRVGTAGTTGSTADCSAGEIVTGGGCSSNGSLIESEPHLPCTGTKCLLCSVINPCHSWYCSATGATTTTASAICCTLQ